MDNRERTRLLMAHLRQVRRAAGLCARCGLKPAAIGTSCDDCQSVRRIKDGEWQPVTTELTSEQAYTVTRGRYIKTGQSVPVVTTLRIGHT